MWVFPNFMTSNIHTPLLPSRENTAHFSPSPLLTGLQKLLKTTSEGYPTASSSILPLVLTLFNPPPELLEPVSNISYPICCNAETTKNAGLGSLTNSSNGFFQIHLHSAIQCPHDEHHPFTSRGC